jgi:hypothetical protein
MNNEVMPMHRPYVLGSLIREDEIVVPMLGKERDRLFKAVAQLVTERDTLNRAELTNKSKFLEYDREINKLNREITGIEKEIQEIYRKYEDARRLSFFEESLPLDEIEIKILPYSSFSERTRHFVFKNSDLQVDDQIQTFISDLFLEDTRSTCLPMGALESLTRDVTQLLNASTEVSLVGSFITLARVKTIEPITIKKTAILSENLLNHASNYYVITGTVLGALFIACGKRISLLKPVDSHQLDSESLNNIASFSLNCFGAIPSVEKEFDKVNLWTLYSNWKEDLRNDSHTGYPIRYRFRALNSILKEGH